MNAGAAASRSAIERALLDFHKSPGKYPLVRKQPPLLFEAVKEVLQFASGRAPDGADASAPSAAVREAACFFIRSALLYPDADHYGLLGLDHDADASAIKDRYRQMMRLMHPDFSGSAIGANWPADAATRLNQAHDVLSSPSRRRAYDEAQNPTAPPVAPAPNREAHGAALRAAAARSPAADQRFRLKQLAVAFGATGTLALLAALYLGGLNEDESLVQRSREIDAMVTAALPREVALAEPEPSQIAATPTDSLQDGAAAQAPSPSELLPQPPAAIAVPEYAKTVASVQTPLPSVLAAPVQPVLREAPRAIAAIQAPPLVAAEPPPTALPSAMNPAEDRSGSGAASMTPAVTTITEPAPPVVVAIAVRASAPATPATVPARGVTLAEVHPLLSKLLQQFESGWGDRVLSVLERDARGAPGAQAVARGYEALLDGGHRVKLSHVQFKAEPRDGRLLVTGRFAMLVGDQPAGAAPKQFAIQAEFASRDGTVVMTRLAPPQEN
jgi:hypothetical protein